MTRLPALLSRLAEAPNQQWAPPLERCLAPGAPSTGQLGVLSAILSNAQVYRRTGAKSIVLID
jgi:hypothetical protein